jgi:hypothetical protein
MFQLDKHDAKIGNVNPRREKHGKEGKPGFDIKFSILTPNTTLDSLQKGLKEALFRKAAKGEQMDAFAGADDLVALRFPLMEPVKLDIELTGCEVYLRGSLEASEETALVDVKLDSFTIRAIEGGSVGIDFFAHVPTSGDVIDELGEVMEWWMVESIKLTVVPPKAQAANDPAPKGDTLDEQDEQKAKDEAARLVEKGKQAA